MKLRNLSLKLSLTSKMPSRIENLPSRMSQKIKNQKRALTNLMNFCNTLMPAKRNSLRMIDQDLVKKSLNKSARN